MRIDDVISAACEELNCSYESNSLWFEVLINQAIRSHKTTKKLIEKTAIIDVYDNKIVLPADFTKLTGLYLCDSPSKTFFCPDVDFTIQGSTLIFISPIADGLRLQLTYMGLYLDDHGAFIIPEDWERMLVSYIGWKYSRRYIKEIGVAVMQNFQREYQTQKLGNI
jgi:hypothetical protein